MTLTSTAAPVRSARARPTMTSTCSEKQRWVANAMADLGNLQGRTYLSQKDARWVVNEFRELAPQVRNFGGKIFAGKVQWIRPVSDGVFAGIDAEQDFAVNASFPVARGYKARTEGIGYTLKLSVWDEGERLRVVISSQASRQADRLRASAALQKLVRMLTDADDILTIAVCGVRERRSGTCAAATTNSPPMLAHMIGFASRSPNWPTASDVRFHGHRSGSTPAPACQRNSALAGSCACVRATVRFTERLDEACGFVSRVL